MKLAVWNNKIKRYNKPVVVEFWAPWCGPCKMMAPYLNQVKTEYAGRVELLKINADDENDLLRELKIFSIPTILVYSNGQLLARKSGALAVDQLRKLFDMALTGKPGKIGLSNSARAFRLIIAAALAAGGFFAHQSIPLYLLSGLVFFSAVYDRCLIWKFISEKLLLKRS